MHGTDVRAAQLSSVSNFTAFLETRIIWTQRQRPPWECWSVLAELAEHISAVSSIRTTLSPLLSFRPLFPPPLPTKPLCHTRLRSPLWLLYSRRLRLPPFRLTNGVFAQTANKTVAVCRPWNPSFPNKQARRSAIRTRLRSRWSAFQFVSGYLFPATLL